MHARSALFDLYGDHLRTRGSQAPVAAVVRLLAPVGIAGPGGAHRDLPDGDAGLAGAGPARRRPRLPGHRARHRPPRPGRRRGSTGWTGPPGTAPGTSSSSRRRASAPPATGCAPTSPSWGTPSWPTTSGSARSPARSSLGAGPGRARPAGPPAATDFDPPPTEAWDLAALHEAYARWPETADGLVAEERRGADERRPGRGGVRRPLPPRARVAQVPLRRPRAAGRAAAARTGRGTPPPSGSRARRARLKPGADRFVARCLDGDRPPDPADCRHEPCHALRPRAARLPRPPRPRRRASRPSR